MLSTLSKYTSFFNFESDKDKKDKESFLYAIYDPTQTE